MIVAAIISMLCVPPTFTEDQLALIKSMANPTIESDTTNSLEQNDDAALIGQRIFLTHNFPQTQRCRAQLATNQNSILQMEKQSQQEFLQ